MKYAMYLRKSRADLDAEAHGEGETLSRHKAALLALAKRLNLTVSEIYIVDEIKKDPENIIQNLKSKKKNKLTPGAKEF